MPMDGLEQPNLWETVLGNMLKVRAMCTALARFCLPARRSKSWPSTELGQQIQSRLMRIVRNETKWAKFYCKGCQSPALQRYGDIFPICLVSLNKSVK